MKGSRREIDSGAPNCRIAAISPLRLHQIKTST
jgi:hypothetical protein